MRNASLSLLFTTALTLTFLAPRPATARTWTDNTGKYTVQGELLDVRDGRARIRRSNGNVTVVPLDRLSDADRRYAAAQGTKSLGGGSKAFEVIGRSASRYAVLAGVNDYERCSDLRYCKADMTGLGKQLVKLGFDARDITLLTDGTSLRPSRRNIVEQLDAVLKVADASDLVVIGLSGHGAKIGGVSYFCPLDARPDDPENTMISIPDLYAKLDKRHCPARLKIVFIDACRNKYLPVEAKPIADQARSIDGFAKSLTDGTVPEGVVMLSSCTSGERSWEEEQFGHGVFMHFVLEGLAGKADASIVGGNTDRWVSLFELCDYVQLETKRHVLRTRRVAQRPHYHTSLDLPDFRLGPVLKTSVARPELPRPGPALGKEYTNSLGMKFRLIPDGEFMMGSPVDEEDRNDNEGKKGPHRVRITQPFYLGIHEVTQGQWKSVMGTEPWEGESYVKEGSDYAASYVSWEDAQEFIKKLSIKEGRRYRLPTEAEWEYACRAGSSTSYHFGDDSSDLGEYAWYEDNAYDIGEEYAHRVGQKRPNAWGLYDMHGNVYEWCEDWYDSGYYSESPTDDPTGPSSGASDRVLRGGGWLINARYCRAAFRSRNSPDYRHGNLGFRLALVPSE